MPGSIFATQEHSLLNRVRHTGLGVGHYAIFALALLTTIAAYVLSSNQSTLRALEHFNREVSNVSSLLRERMTTYEDALRSGVAAINVIDGQMDRASWRAFERSLDLEQRYPGVNGMGIIFHVSQANLDAFVTEQRQDRPEFQIYPSVDSDEHYPITFIEPEAENLAAIGLDMSFEASRHTALLAAAATQTTQMTAPIVLVQDDKSSPGFLIFTPFYEQGTFANAQARRFVGAVYAPFIMERLIDGTLGRDFRSVLIEIHDESATLYSEEASGRNTADPDPMFEEQVLLELFGRTWTVSLETTAGFRNLNDTAAPTLILVFGLIVEASLLILFLSLARANRRAVHLAQSLTEALQIEKLELEASNLALERYNYLSSHDLRTPLRGMHDVTGEIREDLGALFPDLADDHRLSGHLHDLSTLIRQMDSLIGGMVAYSQIGRAKESRAIFSTADELTQLVSNQAKSGATITMTGDVPKIYCNRDLFRIIALHLVSNAVTHHPHPAAAHITVECCSIGRNLILQVEDDGPGIEKHLQGQLFDRLRQPESSSEAPRAQMGLAMVKRAASAIGGYVTFTSQAGAGSSFTVILLDVCHTTGKDAGTASLDKSGQQMRHQQPSNRTAA